MTDIETVPQVFIDETFIGGYPDVKMLHERRYIHEMLLPKPGVSTLIAIATLFCNPLDWLTNILDILFDLSSAD